MKSHQTYSNSTGLSFQCQTDNDSFVITCSIAGRVVGVYRYSQINDTQSHHWVNVDDQFQRIGLGTVLVLHAIDQANYMGLGYGADSRGYSRDLARLYDKLMNLGLVEEYQDYYSLTALGRLVLHK